MSTQNSEPEVPIRRLDRILAFTALGIAAASVVCFFAIIIGTALGMDQGRLRRYRRGASQSDPRRTGGGAQPGADVSTHHPLVTGPSYRGDRGWPRRFAIVRRR
ncbi:hypothetical protein [Microbacterium sp. BF1]|uniref:hypothetical protein n=1 Tax=Microbacterium sp. BF1 TaxID=2821146 RepID=UPI002119BB6F|nr:hypothetical protein [Microbacterium sp. BF1]